MLTTVIEEGLRPAADFGAGFRAKLDLDPGCPPALAGLHLGSWLCNARRVSFRSYGELLLRAKEGDGEALVAGLAETGLVQQWPELVTQHGSRQVAEAFAAGFLRRWPVTGDGGPADVQ